MTDPDSTADGELALRMRAKQVMRQRMRTVRRALPASACQARSQAVCDRVVALPAFESARTVVGYVAFAKEADPAPVLARAHALGKRVGLVRVEDEQTLSARLYREGDPLVPNARGIEEPDPAAETLALHEIDLIIVPALGLDERGYRLGYGGGFYDRFLPRLPRAHRVAIAYDFQLLFEIPDTPGDARVDTIVTDKHTLARAAVDSSHLPQ